MMRRISSLSWLAGHERLGLEGVRAAVQAQTGFAAGGIGAVAGEAILGQDGPNVAIVAQRLAGAGAGGP